MVDKMLVLKKLASLAEYCKQLDEFSTLTVAGYRADWKVQRIVERTLQMMIELCADVAGHLISDQGLRTPETYADTFRVLGENEILSAEQTAVMEKMAKFRNIVVHQYETVDAEIVILVLQQHLEDFDRFSAAVVKQLRLKD
ncbi:MAG: hypothetical protein A2005_12535 [Desulfuromonadales bacterium GWC2_61_20]|nr:MAG: hypothetical protein A2005_12535 [Desulfuromonadales bacterium GWC2_61_20]HBT84173.1 DUF86 domain-containing protein [Desulfuromonas sp.]